MMSTTYVPYEKNPARFSVTSSNDLSETTRNAYLHDMSPRQAGYGKKGGRLNPMNWALWKRLVLAAAIVIIIIAIIVGAVVGTRSSRYPAYSKLNYKATDTYQGSSFFNNFNYFEGYDPTQGFVHYNPMAAAQRRI